MVGLTFGGTAYPGNDYTQPNPASVTIVLPPYATTGNATLDVVTKRDNDVEGTETLVGRVGSFSGPNAGAIANPPPSSTATIGDDPARVSIEGTPGPVAEHDGPVTLTARRSGGDTSQRLTAVLQVSGAAGHGSDYTVPGAVTFEAGVSSVLVPVTIIDDGRTESPRATPGWSEEAIVGVAPGGNVYVASGNPATLNLGDDATWLHTPWELTDDYPQPMRTPVRHDGTRVVIRDNGAGPVLVVKTVTEYYSYDTWVPFHVAGDTSKRWEDDRNDIDTSFTVGFTDVHEESFELSGGAGPLNITLYQNTSGTNFEVSKSFPLIASAGEDEKVRVVPLLKRTTHFAIVTRYVDRERTGNWEYLDTSRLDIAEGYRLEGDQAVFKRRRHWLDPEASGAAGLLTEEPADSDATFDELLPDR